MKSFAFLALLILVQVSFAEDEYLRTRKQAPTTAPKAPSPKPIRTRRLIQPPLEKTSNDPVTWGILAGANFGYAAAEPAQSGSTKAGLSLRGFVNFPLSENFSIEPQVAYVQRGVNGSIDVIGISLKANLTMNYVEFSTLLNYRARIGEKFHLNVGAGPAFGFAIVREVEVVLGIKPDITERYSSTDFLLALGVGLDYEIAERVRALIRARYSMGMSDLDIDANNPDRSYQTRGMELLAGVAFPF